MIVLGAVLPHPPVLLPEIGKGRESQAQATLDAYRTVADRLRESGVRRLMMISTHGIVTLGRFHLLTGELSGNLGRFDAPTVTFRHRIDGELSEAIFNAAQATGVPLAKTHSWEESDHSVGVPLTLLGDALPEQIAIVSVSFRPPADHYELGLAIGEALSAFEEPTAILASGDAVHTLTDASAYGRHRRADEVQQQYESALMEWSPETLCEIDEALRRQVDESIISPTLILMGAMNGLSVHPHMLGTEHPWGVGYVTSVIEVG